MREIKKVLLCGLGAIGGYYAAQFEKNGLELKVLTDAERLERYSAAPRIINGEEYNFEYVLPECEGYCADLIIIATKSSGLEAAINNIRNFVGEDTIILSFLNGITSEKKLAAEYGEKVLYSYLLGHTFFRNGNNIIHDGKAKIVFGSTVKNDVRVLMLKSLFDRIGALYEVPEDIIKSQWRKFCFNCCVNQISAVTGKTFGEMKVSSECMELMKDICSEITEVAKSEGIEDADFYNSVLRSLDLMLPEGKTSMLQDIEAGRKPEADLFGKAVVDIGVRYGIDTPVNKMLYEKISTMI